MIRRPSFWETKDWQELNSHPSQMAKKLCDAGIQLIEDTPSDLKDVEMITLDVEAQDAYLHSLLSGLDGWMALEHRGWDSCYKSHEWYQSHEKLIELLLEK